MLHRNEVTITSTPQISSIGKVTTTNTLHKVGTLTMTNSRALDLGIDPISGEVTIVDGSTGATCTKYTRNTVSGVREDITGNPAGADLVPRERRAAIAHERGRGWRRKSPSMRATGTASPAAS